MTHKQGKTQEKQKEDEVSKRRIIDRKEAIKKTGYFVLSAATMMLLLSNPAKANGGPVSSPANPLPW